MAVSNEARRETKGKPFPLSRDIAAGFAEHLRYSPSGHFPIYDGDRIIGVLVSVEQFNLLLHLAQLLDDPKIAAAVAGTHKQDEKEHYLSFEEVFGS